MLRLRLVFYFNDTAPTEIYTLSLHDALPIWRPGDDRGRHVGDVRLDHLDLAGQRVELGGARPVAVGSRAVLGEDRKSTRLNSSHANISYAVFCLKKK